MARMVQNENQAAGAFFFATLVLWLLSLSFEIVFNKRNELLCVIAGCCFFQTANWVIRFRFSKDPLFVNTSVSLLHSFIISSSGSFPISSFWVFFSLFFIWVYCYCAVVFSVANFSTSDESGIYSYCEFPISFYRLFCHVLTWLHGMRCVLFDSVYKINN